MKQVLLSLAIILSLINMSFGDATSVAKNSSLAFACSASSDCTVVSGCCGIPFAINKEYSNDAGQYSACLACPLTSANDKPPIQIPICLNKVCSLVDENGKTVRMGWDNKVF